VVSVVHSGAEGLAFKSQSQCCRVTVRACLDQLLIVIRSLLIVSDHVRSRERLITISRPIATPLGGRHDSVLSIKCGCRCLADYKHSMGTVGRRGVSESVAAAARAVLR